MNHPSEHDLEMYVLEEDSVHSRRAEIESHLAACAGCRTLVGNMQAFYAQARAEEQGPHTHAGDTRLPVVRIRRPLTPLYQPVAPAAVVHDRRWLGRFVRSARRHPVRSIGGTLALGAIALAGLLTVAKPRAVTMNPSYATINTLAGELQVFNASDELMWKKPVANVERFLVSGALDMQRYVAIADLDGDGLREVATSLPLGDDKPFRQLTVLNGTGTLRAELPIGEPLLCRGRQYPDDFLLTWFTVDEADSALPGTIVISASNRNSPSIITRYDAQLHQVGRYLHFGHLGLMTRCNVDGKGRDEIVAFGINDNDENGAPEAVAVVLDPMAIVGDGESSSAGGFGVPVSRAERLYIEIPRSELAVALGRSVVLAEPRVVRLKVGNGIRVVAYGSQRNDLPVFEYIFDSSLRVAEVKSADFTKQAYDSLAARSGNTTNFYTSYLPHVASQVKYWNGREWITGRVAAVMQAP